MTIVLHPTLHRPFSSHGGNGLCWSNIQASLLSSFLPAVSFRPHNLISHTNRSFMSKKESSSFSIRRRFDKNQQF